MDDINWQNTDVWGSWTYCNWMPAIDVLNGWSCLLPEGHQGEHIGPQAWESIGPGEKWYVSKNGLWVLADPCERCQYMHPGLRHATRNDPIVIGSEDNGNWFGPYANAGFPTHEPDDLTFVPTFFTPLPTPPKFTSIEEADAWMEANQ